MKSDKQPIELSKFDNADFDRGASRVTELLWMIAKWLFFRGHFPLPSALRRFLLRSFGASVGEGLVIRSGVNITYPWRLTIGDHCWIGEDVTILSLAQVTIGNHCCISQRAFLCTGSHDFSKETFDLITEPIKIGSHSWVAANAFVGPGCEIPRNTLVKAGVVAKKADFKV